VFYVATDLPTQNSVSSHFTGQRGSSTKQYILLLLFRFLHCTAKTDQAVSHIHKPRQYTSSFSTTFRRGEGEAINQVEPLCTVEGGNISLIFRRILSFL
jgi:hypothetical protein